MSEWVQPHQAYVRDDPLQRQAAFATCQIPRSAWPVYERYKRLKRQANGLEVQFNDAWITAEAVRRLLKREGLSVKARYGLEELLPGLEDDCKQLEGELGIARYRMRGAQWDFRQIVRGGVIDPEPPDTEGYTDEPNSTMLNEGKTVPEGLAETDSALREDAAETPATDPKDKLVAELTGERDALKDQLLRVMAEAQNVQRRLRQQMDESRRFASQPLVERLLPVLDSFERSIAAAEKGSSVEALLEGVKAVERQLRTALESAEVVRIESVGKPYDPELHEALVAVETSDQPADTVLDEIEAGYTMHGRVVRPAKVRVSKQP